MGRRRRKGAAIDGWLVIDKPLGVTSNDAVVRARRALNAAKVGHGGTLDPLATGILPLAFGEATKTMAFAMDGAKVYRFTIRWGEARATDDAEGEITATSPHRPSPEEINAALPAFVGEIQQTPPAFSAIKVDGKRAYDLARADVAVEMRPRQVIVHEFRLIRVLDADRAEFETRTGKGVYVRALARDLAKALGTLGHVAALRRTTVGPFTEDMAISLDKIEDVGHSPRLLEALLPVETALADIPALALTEVEAGRLQHGQPVAALPVLSRVSRKDIKQGDTVSAMSKGKLIAIAQVMGGEIRPLRVMNIEGQGENDVDNR